MILLGQFRFHVIVLFCNRPFVILWFIYYRQTMIHNINMIHSYLYDRSRKKFVTTSAMVFRSSNSMNFARVMKLQRECKLTHNARICLALSTHREDTHSHGTCLHIIHVHSITIITSIVMFMYIESDCVIK